MRADLSEEWFELTNRLALAAQLLSGTVHDVNNLLKQYSEMRKMMKQFSGGMMSGMLGKKLGKMKLPPGFPFGPPPGM